MRDDTPSEHNQRLAEEHHVLSATHRKQLCIMKAWVAALVVISIIIGIFIGYWIWT